MDNGAELHDRANLYGAMQHELKLRVLAKLNLLPSWWFLRTRILALLSVKGFAIDDGVMDTQFDQAAEAMARMMEKYKRLTAQAQVNDQGGSGRTEG